MTTTVDNDGWEALPIPGWPPPVGTKIQLLEPHPWAGHFGEVVEHKRFTVMGQDRGLCPVIQQNLARNPLPLGRGGIA